METITDNQLVGVMCACVVGCALVLLRSLSTLESQRKRLEAAYLGLCIADFVLRQPYRIAWVEIRGRGIDVAWNGFTWNIRKGDWTSNSMSLYDMCKLIVEKYPAQVTLANSDTTAPETHVLLVSTDKEPS